jgi:ribonuclease P protein component
VVSKKLLSLATDRNYLRRQFYQILRQRPATLPGCDYSILVRPAVLKLDFSARQAKLLQTLEQISPKSDQKHG